MNSDSLITNVLDKLIALGFPSFLEWEIKVHTCFLPKQFVVNYEQRRANDLMCYAIYIKHDEDLGIYLPTCYDATFKKAIEIPKGVVNEDTLSAINLEMQLIEWASLIAKGGDAKVCDLSQLNRIAEINQQLVAIEASDEGAYYAKLMKIRYWARSPFEVYAPAHSAIRHALEVSQRFHFFEGENGITLDEAYRYLSHRWREKQLAYNLHRMDQDQVAKRRSRSKKNSRIS